MKRELLDNGNIWQKSDGRWIGMVRYRDEYGATQRKSFSSKKKKTLQAKMTEYVKNFNEQVSNSDEAQKTLLTRFCRYAIMKITEEIYPYNLTNVGLWGFFMPKTALS